MIPRRLPPTIFKNPNVYNKRAYSIPAPKIPSGSEEKKEVMIKIIQERMPYCSETEKTKLKEIGAQIVFSDLSDKELTEIFLQFSPAIRNEQKILEKRYDDEYNDLSNKLTETKKIRVSYVRPRNEVELKKCNDLIIQLEKKLIENLEGQKVFYGNCKYLDLMQQNVTKIVNVTFDNRLEKIGKELKFLKTDLAVAVLKKDLAPSSAAIKTFDIKNKELQYNIITLISAYQSESPFDDRNLANQKSPETIEKELAKSYSNILKKFTGEVPQMEEDLVKELRNLEGMLGGSSPSETLAINKMIEKIKLRLGILVTIREMKAGVEQTGKLDLKVLQLIQMITTEYKVHDQQFLIRSLALLKNYIFENPVKTSAALFSIKPLIMLLGLLVASYYINSELDDLNELKMAALDNDMAMSVVDTMVETADRLKIDLDDQTKKTIEELKKAVEKRNEYIDVIDDIKKAKTINDEMKIAVRYCDSLSQEELETLTREKSTFENMFNPYYHKKVTVEKIEVKDPVMHQTICDTFNGISEKIGNELHDSLSRLKDAAVICSAISDCRLKAHDQMQPNTSRSMHLISDLANKIQIHVNSKNSDYSQQVTSYGYEGIKEINEIYDDHIAKINAIKKTYAKEINELEKRQKRYI